MSVKSLPPYTTHLYSKNGVYREIHIFLIFDPKQRLLVLTIYVLSKNITNIIFSMEFKIFAFEKILCILHGQVFVMII